MKNSPNFYQVKEEVEAQMQAEDRDMQGKEREEDDNMDRFERWAWLMQTRVDAEGNYPEPGILFREWDKYKSTHPQAASGTREANWMPMGSATVPAEGGGAGRVNVIALDPNDPDNTIYVGTAGGGVWRSQDAGTTWLPLTDNIPVTSIADIAIDPTNSNNIYVATGDGYGYEATWQSDNDFWGGVYSAGVVHSTDGGATWSPTGLSYLQEDLQIVQRLIIHPTNPDILLAATRTGIFRTDDGGDTWTLVNPAHCYDMAFNTANPDIIYASSSSDIYVSDDAGATWSVLNNSLCGSGRVSIETTNADPDVIYVLCESGDMRKSTNGGTSFSNVTDPDTHTSFYGYYDTDFGVSNVDADVLFAGGLEVVRSTNGSSSWSKKSDASNHAAPDYVHADGHAVCLHPTNDNIVYVGNDGGIFRSDDMGDNWTDLSNGLRIAQAYRISTTPMDPNRVLSGWQDNGSNLWDGNYWEEIDATTYDGMEAIIDPTDTDIMFICHQYGAVYRTLNGGISWLAMSNGGGSWLTPYVMDPTDHEILYSGDSYGDIHKSTNGGSTWTNKSTTIGDEVFAIAVAPSDHNTVYACSLNKLEVTTNGGDTWSNITGTLPHSGIGFNYIAISNTDPAKVWIALSGYSDGNKVYYSDDMGSTWSNISGTLPNVPVNTIVYQNDSPDRLYIGTDLGVFYKDDTMGDWESYMNGLPNVMVHELEINYASHQLVAATYGRGIWHSNLADYVTPVIDAMVTETTYCPGADINVVYTATGPFDAGNVLTAQLSDASGGFASPVNIGTLSAVTATGVIPAIIPASTPSGTGYRVRVNSSSPAITGNPNADDLTVDCPDPTGLTVNSVGAGYADVSWDAVDCAAGYTLEYKESAAGVWTYITGLTTNSTTISGLSAGTDYQWAVQTQCVISPDAHSDYSAVSNFTTLQTGIFENGNTLGGLQVYPDPFQESTVIRFSTLYAAPLSIDLTDAEGRLVRVIADHSDLPAGDQTLTLHRNGLGAGLYILRITNNLNGDAMYARIVIY